jgi:O-methyltransferase
MTLAQRVFCSRWGWFLQGLPSLARARALFRVRRATMTSARRCRLLWDQCNEIFRRGVPGSFVECGVWRGGSSAVMALAARRVGQNRQLHLFDSFEGLPEPQKIDEAGAAEYSGGRSSGSLQSIDRCKAELAEVEAFLFGDLRLNREAVHFHVGWFQHTVAAAGDALGDVAVLRLDGDWYESTKVCLEHLYPKLSRGGVLILDDYFAWVGCKKATDEYRASHNITTPITRIDVDAAYWVKE